LYFIAFWCGWELVTFSPYPLAKAPDVSNAGRHLSAAEFHSVLQNAGGVLLYREWMNGNGMSWEILHMFLREAWR